MVELVLATRNRDKIREIKRLLEGCNVRLLTLEDFPSCPVIEEDGRTLEENAKKKALVVAEYTGKVSLSEDTGLEVKALGGAPGVYSARFAGENATYEDNNKKLLQLMERIPQEERKAVFRCVVAIAKPDGTIITCEGKCVGRIGFEMRGTSGFGYDPVFIVPEYGKTFAELGEEVKNKISHRAKAFAQVRRIINSLY